MNQKEKEERRMERKEKDLFFNGYHCTKKDSVTRFNLLDVTAFHIQSILLRKIRNRESRQDIVANVLDCHIVASEFELQ